MPVRVVCKACSATLTAPDSAAGKAVVCPKCKASLVVPAADAGYEVVDDEPAVAKPKLPTPKRRVIDDDYDDDDRPRKKKRKPEPKGIPAWAIIVPVLLVLLLIGGAIAAWLFWPKAKSPPTQVAPTMPSLFGTPPVTWTPFTCPDGSFVASFPNGPPQTASDGGAGGSGLTLPEMPGLGGALGKGGNMADLAKDYNIAFGMYSRLDAAGMFSVSFASMPAILGQAPSADSFWKDAKLGPQPDGSELIVVEPTTIGGYPGKRALARVGGNLVDTRITVVKGRTFTVKAAVQTSSNDSPLFKAFFDAFQIKNVPDPKPVNMPGLEIPKDLDPLKKP